MIRTTLQYLTIFLKSLSMDLRPRSSCHFLEALVKAFFLLLYLQKINRNGCLFFADNLQEPGSVTCQPHHSERRLCTLQINLSKKAFHFEVKSKYMLSSKWAESWFKLILIRFTIIHNAHSIYINIKLCIQLPVLIESSAAIFWQVFSPYRGQSAQTMWSFNIPNHTNNDHRWCFQNGNCFHNFLLIYL